jgi:hypothetical protein
MRGSVAQKRHAYVEHGKKLNEIKYLDGGGGGIRTHERRQPLPVFKTGAFNRSATPPPVADLILYHASHG